MSIKLYIYYYNSSLGIPQTPGVLCLRYRINIYIKVLVVMNYYFTVLMCSYVTAVLYCIRIM